MLTLSSSGCDRIFADAEIGTHRQASGERPRPFQPIPRLPRARHRQHALMKRIWAAEAKLAKSLHSVNQDLERRAARKP